MPRETTVQLVDESYFQTDAVEIMPQIPQTMKITPHPTITMFKQTLSPFIFFKFGFFSNLVIFTILILQILQNSFDQDGHKLY